MPMPSGDEAAQRRRLEAKLAGGSATVSEMRLLKALCKHVADRVCVERVNAALAARGVN